ncbi:MAG: extracellular solute-binding protein [Actinobacteria bacterium]|nr:extracellular solute-binding protein [Actinomycetota bacterium]
MALGVLVAGCGSGSSSEPSGATEASAGSEAASAGTEKLDGGGASFVYNAAGASAQFEEALKASYLKAFDEKFNFNSSVDPFCCGIDKLQAAESSGNVPWSAVQWLNSSDFKLAEEAELLEPLDTSVVPVHLLKPGTYDKYGYQVYITGVLLGWKQGTYKPGEQPTSLVDLFNTKKYPGKRCLYKGIQDGGNFEAAELAAGVPPNELYPINQELAFEELDKIKSEIVWWETGAQAAQYLLDGTCTMGVIWSGVAQTATNEGNPIDVTWNEALTVYGMNSIPRGSPNPEAAQQFLALILDDPAATETFAEHTAYLSPLKKPAPLPPDVAEWAPQGENVANTIVENDNYYAEHNAELTKAFNEWLVTG